MVLTAAWLLLVPGAGAADPAQQWTTPLAPPLVVTRGFSPGPRNWLPGHRGVDLAAASGASVRSAGAGVVVFAGILAGRGVVSVDHGGLRTTYEPLAPSVAEGDRVGAGSLLGRLLAGHGDPPPGRVLLHWGARRGATYVDPMSLIGLGPLRLLPRWDRHATAVDGAVVRRGLDATGQREPWPPMRRDGRPRTATAVVLGLAGVAGLAAAGSRRSQARRSI